MMPNSFHTTDITNEESYYELLRITPSATTAEVVNAYHAAKNAYSKDSVATYSLFDAADSESFLTKLEQAYLTLSNIERRRNYDRMLSHKNQNPDEEPVPMNNTNVPTNEPKTAPIAATGISHSSGKEGGINPAPLHNESSIPSIGNLVTLRESRGLSLEDVARITKIPAKFISAIETLDIPKLPAKVYIQGFIKNLSQLYKIDAKETVTLYLAEIDKQSRAKQN